MKKVITFVLVLVMLSSVLLVSASAAEIQPRAPVMRCECGGYAYYIGTFDGYPMFECEACGHIYLYQHVG